MKKNISIVLLCFLLLIKGLYAQKEDSFTILSNAQKQIDFAFLESFREGDVLPLQREEDLLNKISIKNSETITHYKNYWISYVKYKKALYYFRFNKKKKSEEEVANSIKLLESIENKNSEIFSLLSLQQSFYFQFIPKQEFIIYLNKITENLEKAIVLNSKNLRAYYVNANYDFYTPEEYGGGKKTEKMLLNAVSLNDKSENSSFAPSWGKQLSFDLLIQHYLKKEELEKAKKYYQQAIKIYPFSSILGKHEKIVMK
jgi:tetratricopeptide (TPR) repeat protein